MGIVKLYEVYDEGVSLGDFTSKEAAEFLQIPRSAVVNCANTGCTYRGRYTFEVVDTLDIKSLLPVWDKMRKEIKTAGR
ncbi:hypothetical protein AALB39_27445 [Lachnospiraceae bacterium 54-53]